MCCAHCLRGDAESIDIQEKYIDAFLDNFEKGAYISSLTFTGGEISLNIPAIRYTLKAVKERGIAVGSFYMVTNGKLSIRWLTLLWRVWSGGPTAMKKMTICAVFASAVITSTK
jgi:pyruvate-formate lyase-activating enzyme